MDAVFNKYERLPRYIQFIFAVFVPISIYCILSILSYALYAEAIFHIDRYIDPYWISRANQLLQGIGMSVVVLLLFRLIVLTYFEGDAISKLDVTITTIYSQLGIYTFIYFMTHTFAGEYIPSISGIFNALEDALIFNTRSSTSIPIGWLFSEKGFDVLSITVVIILVLQLLYLQHSRNRNTHSAAYWKAVIVLAIVFCVAYMFVISRSSFLIPVMGGAPDNTPIVYITAITGLVSAVSALYSQILAGKKIKIEMEQLNAQKASRVTVKVPKKKAGGKSTQQRKSKQPS